MRLLRNQNLYLLDSIRRACTCDNTHPRRHRAVHRAECTLNAPATFHHFVLPHTIHLLNLSNRCASLSEACYAVGAPLQTQVERPCSWFSN